MSNVFPGLKSADGEVEVNFNFMEFGKRLAILNLLAPGEASFLNLGDREYQDSGVVVKGGTVKVGSVVATSGSPAASDFTVKLTGTMAKIASADAETIFGSGTDNTNAVILALPTPCAAYTEIKVGGNAIDEDDFAVIDGVGYYFCLIGTYTAGKSTPTTAKAITIGGITKSVQFDCSGVTLAE